MKENRGKDVSEGKRPEAQPQDQPKIQTQGRLTAGDKRKSLPKNLDLEGLPNHQDKRAKHSSSKVVKFKPPQFQPSIQIVDVDSSTPIESSPSKTPSSKIPSSKSTVSGSSQPSEKTSKNIIENENLAWERFQMAVLDEDINVCYDMGLKEFEHSGVHNLFKVRPYSILVLVYLTIFLHLTILFFIGHVKVYGGIQTGNRTGQDEDSIGDKDSRGEC